ncbi:MAG TPA: hypothetical protein VD794_08740 [Flavisolibacter sp.]|nr:hypothetical protein [Flavisolibacter sp.]
MESRYGPYGTQPVRRGRGISRFFRAFLVILLLGLGIFIYWKYAFTYSNGNRYGLLQKFSEKGTLFKTYEGELILSSVRGNLNVPIASEKFFFSVKDRDVAQKLMDLQGQPVTVHYKEKNGTLPWRGETRYIVDSVRVQ